MAGAVFYPIKICFIIQKKEEPKFKATVLNFLSRVYSSPYPANEARHFQ